MSRRGRRYWLLKSEPHVFSYGDLERSPKRTTPWDGVRNYQARNFLRDELRPGDGVLFYHSSAKPMGIAGLAVVSSEPYPDPTQFERGHTYADPKSDPDDPRWYVVDVEAVRPVEPLITLAEIKANKKLAKMALVQRGSRLSVQPVRPAEWREVLRMAGVPHEKV